MKYFHRTAVSPDTVLEEADRFFGGSLTPGPSEPRARQFRGTIGEITVDVKAEGGHYTLVTVKTDQLGESEADKLAKRFMANVHQLAEPTHQVRGAY